ncbi:FMN reductase [NAD(P)H] [Sporomusa carbonis]|uniref:nitroreductase family protein n=1 Tax=Sporomusa carbonis TaxID=3076075 RepID=UPI003A61AE8A
MTANNVIQTIKNRRSIRTYQEEQIKEAELQAILEAGIYAPTGHNDQPWHFTVIRNKEFINHMSEKTKEVMKTSPIGWVVKIANSDRHIFYNAPTVIVVSGRKNAYSPLTDCSAAIQNMLVAAESMNIGSVWIGLIDHLFTLEDEVKKFELPEGYQPYYAVCLGYKKDQSPVPAPKRNMDVINFID